MRNLTCIICPKGCSLTVEESAEGLSVVGNICPRGKKYAIEECTHPVRTVTSFIRVENREDTMVSVKTSAPIPKESMFEAMEKIRAAKANAPIAIGDVLLADVFGADIIATKSID
ncbi:MAG: DUF1667 domain-containing protein [Ruminococcaceae bacterium]|nr:DUF1667 domain-containing protein [Oscillospiraceae bacterium]